MDKDQVLRDQLVKLLQGGQAYQPLEVYLSGISAEVAGKTAADLPYTIWQLIDHMRFTLHDILDFSRNPGYVEPNWPDDYWPKEKSPKSQQALDECIKDLKEGMQEMIRLVQDQNHNLYEPFPHGSGQNLLREAMLVAEHNAYHLGQIMVLRRLLGDWEV
ncbi:DinB family protein [Pontibacter sp. JH31]|uniref:DinB family protein n=1 Tax=Pontibacter aquaedesilientis TaxID=2766980 RepID=A0ABR7XDT9_9BACT|nr:DinB family protein [Pontibacter aquaedesilientis]MBD1395773.1 DinB family protein [Pontibacter aquaedesilientis]